MKYLLENREQDAPDTAYGTSRHLLLRLLTPACRVYNKTLEYVKTFTKFNTTDSASAVREYVHDSCVSPTRFISDSHRTLRREDALTQFETAQIANLCPADAEEAKSIIPRCVKCPQPHSPFPDR